METNGYQNFELRELWKQGRKNISTGRKILFHLSLSTFQLVGKFAG